MKGLWTPFIIVLCFVCLVFTQSACQKDHGKRGPSSRHVKVALRLKWLFNASTLGEIWALEKGVYERNGLDVTLKEGGAESDALTELELGRVQFGIASGDQVLRAASKGARPVVLAQIFQKNPLEWIYIKERVQITAPMDLKGKTVGITFGGNDETIFKAIMAKYGLRPGRDVHLYAVHYDYAPFWRGEVDLWPVYKNTQGVFLTQKIKKEGQTPGFLDPHGLGISFVANCLVTSRDFYVKHPQVVEKMLRAELTAWRQALSPHNLDEAVRLLKKYEPDLDESTLREQVQETRRMILGARGEAGTIDRRAWHETLRLMRNEGLVQGPVDLTQILAQTK